jgi:demethylmenaquinone methyltransferase/2-methoxy-6-polyprenyl-1,4-benzoquinol methylase
VDDLDDLLAEQSRYYRDRAPEYDDWWLRRGRYDRGEESNERWAAEGAQVQAALEAFDPAGDVLELACGTGLWTRHLASSAGRLTAIDGSPEALAIARARVPNENVTFQQADIFTWEPTESYDVCFFGFWLSHVPHARLDAFWRKVRRALEPGGRVFFVDSLRSEMASAADHTWPGEGEETMLRRLADGREYLMVKRFDEPAELERRLGEMGFRASVRTTGEFFIYGEGAVGAR